MSIRSWIPVAQSFTDLPDVEILVTIVELIVTSTWASERYHSTFMDEILDYPHGLEKKMQQVLLLLKLPREALSC